MKWTRKKLIILREEKTSKWNGASRDAHFRAVRLIADRGGKRPATGLRARTAIQIVTAAFSTIRTESLVAVHT